VPDLGKRPPASPASRFLLGKCRPPSTEVHLDETARRFLEEAAANGEVRIIANEPHARDLLEYIEKAYEERLRHGIPPDDPVLFLEVTVADPSEFEARLQVTGEERHGYRDASPGLRRWRGVVGVHGRACHRAAAGRRGSRFQALSAGSR
jgi:hypothetical protein